MHCWQRIRQLKKRKRGLVAKHALPIGPKPHDHKVFVVGRGKVGESVDASSNADDTTSRGVVTEQLV